MPPQSGLAFVLIQHLDPFHKSILADLLSKNIEMPVVLAEDGMPIAPNQVFVIPPNAVLTIDDGILRVDMPAPPRAQRKPIDTFLASLAQDQQEKAVCIILAGSGSDGSLERSKSMEAWPWPRPDSIRWRSWDAEQRRGDGPYR